MASIYNIPVWKYWGVEGDFQWPKNQIVHRVPGQGNAPGTGTSSYYYALQDIYWNQNWDPEDALHGATYWGGMTNYNGRHKPNFIWKSSYNASSQKAPVVKSIRFGDGYEQRIKDGVSHNLLLADLEFAQRSETETSAILHFLEARGGTESFVFKPSPPYDKAGLYVCRNWSSSYVFYDNYSIKGQFEEVPE